MLKYELVNKELIISNTARRVYRIAAGFSVILFFELWGLEFENISVPAVALPALKLLLFLGILGAAIIIVGMEVFLFRFDDSHALKQVFWFVVMLFPFLGAPLYCFFVYSRSQFFKSNTDQRAAGVSV